MRKSVLLVLAAAALALPSPARAQFAQIKDKVKDRVIVSANVGLEAAGSDLERNSTFDLYDEQASVDVAQSIKGSGFFEFGAQYKLNPKSQYGVGFAYGFLSSKGDGTIAGSLPHPQFFDEPREFSASATDLKRTEHSLHFQGIYYIPFTEKVSFTVSGGPSIFNVKQNLIRAVEFSENPPSFRDITIDRIDVIELKDSGWGFNLGADATYVVTPRIGVAGIIRYTHGNVEFNVSDTQTADVKAGGFQIGVGVRYKF